MRLIDSVKTANRRLVIPLMGYPGIQLNHTSIKQNEFNWGVHFWTLSTLVRAFEPDGVFFFMDLSVEASALGLPVRFPLYESPSVEQHLVQELNDLNQFLSCDPLRDGRTMAYVETMKLMKEGLPGRVMKGAYVTGPFTLAGLMMGANDIAMKTIMDEQLVKGVLEVATATIIRYALALQEAGADTIAVLEPTAVMLSPDSFKQFSADFIERIIRKLDIPSVLHICGEATHLVPTMCKTGAQGLSLDTDIDLKKVMPMLPEDIVLIGNVDPVDVVRNATPQEVREVVHQTLETVKEYPNFILSSGCDIPADAPLKNIHAFMDAANEWNHQNYDIQYALG